MCDAHLAKTLAGFVIAMLLTACGGGGGGGGSGGEGGGDGSAAAPPPNPAPASAGFIVAARTNPREINIYRVDQPNVPIQTIPNAKFTAGNGIFDVPEPKSGFARGSRIGTHWGIPGVSYMTKLGIFTTSTAVVLGAEPGHEYQYLGYIASLTPRVYFRDMSSTTMSIRSANLDGTDSREIISGCRNIDLWASSPAGLVSRCDVAVAGGPDWRSFYSDGVSAGIEITTAGAKHPKAVTATHAVFYDPTSFQLYAYPLVAPFFEANMVPDSGSSQDSTEIHVNPQGIVWTRIFEGGVYKIWMIDLESPYIDGKPPASHRFTSVGAPLFEAISVDGSYFAAIYMDQASSPGTDRSWIQPFEGSAVSPIDVTPSGSDIVSDINFLDNGKFLVTRGPDGAPTGIYLYDADGSNERQMGLSGLRVSPEGIRGDYALFIDANGPGALQSVNLAVGGGLWTMENAAAAPVPSFVSPLGATTQYVTYVNDAKEAWIATADPDLGIKQRIDLIPTNLIMKIGEGPGNRIFLSLRREQGMTVQSDIVMVDLDTLVTTPLVSGPTDDYGLYFPK